MIRNVTAGGQNMVRNEQLKESHNKMESRVERQQEKDRVARLKEAVQNGTYDIDLQKTASRIAEDLAPSLFQRE